jgi:hypothetical protein
MRSAGLEVDLTVNTSDFAAPQSAMQTITGDIVPKPLAVHDWNNFAGEYPLIAAHTSAIELHRQLQRHLAETQE